MPEGGPRFVLRGPERRGAQGRVQRAFDQDTGREVALKRPVDLQPAAVTDFLREAALLASVRHPALVAYVDHGLDPELGLFLATEWVDGESLADRLAAGTLSLDEALLLGARLADGLSALHAGGIRHGDVQPANVLLPSGRPEGAVLIDLGLAARHRFRGADESRGTPGFSAPEVALGGRIELASDLFSLGVLLWTCLAGHGPFEALDPAHTLARAALAEPRPLDHPGLPASLGALLGAMLARSPARRPRADEVRDQLLGLGTPERAEGPPRAGVALRGRDRELAWLEATAAAGRVVLVRGPSGVGKSELRRAWSAHMRADGQGVWEASGQPDSPPFAVLRGLLGSALGLDAEHPAPDPGELAAFVARWLPVAEIPLVIALLGDFWDLPTPAGADPLVALSRSNPALRAQLLEPSFVGLVGAVAASGPLALVVDDLHAIDAPSLLLLERAVERTGARLAAFGRPWSTGDGLVPFADQPLEQLALEGLDADTARALVAELWPEATPAQCDEVVAQADGLPGFLVELTAAHRRSPVAAGELLEALLAARLARRSPLEKRVLWATALLGHRVARVGVAALLDDLSSTGMTDVTLARLVSAGLLVHDETGDVVSFRPGALREVALAHAPPAVLEPLLGRALAWLQPRGEHEALLAWMAERAGRSDEAAHRYAAAGWRALGLDFPSALRLAERSLACASGADRDLASGGRLLALAWMGRWAATEPLARDALERAPAGGPLWVIAAGVRCLGLLEAGRTDLALGALAELGAVEPAPDARSWLLLAMGLCALPLTGVAAARPLVERLERRLTALLPAAPRPALAASACQLRALLARSPGDDLGQALAAADQAVRLHQADGSAVLEAQARVQLGLLWLAAGGLAEADEHLAEALRTAERAGAEGLAVLARLGLVDTRVAQGRPEQALALALRTLAAPGLRDRPVARARGLRSLAAAHLALGDPDEALRATDEALALLPAPCPERLAALVVRADALTSQGRSDQAVAAAEQAVAIVDAADPLVLDEPGARACLAELRLAAGSLDEARRLLADARHELLGRVARLDPAQLPAFLARPSVRRVLDRARYWLPPSGLFPGRSPAP